MIMGITGYFINDAVNILFFNTINRRLKSRAAVTFLFQFKINFSAVYVAA